MNKIKKIIKNSSILYHFVYEIFKISSYIINDENYIKIKYFFLFKKKINLKAPKTLNEKIQWRKLNERKEIFTKLTDKYEVRKYVKEKIGEKYLIPLLGVYKNVNEIDYESLPNQFVLKCNHDAGSTIICKDKKLNNEQLNNKKLKFFMKRNFYYMTREWHYYNINPLIICEKYIPIFQKNDLNQDLPEDYKLHCFNGKVEIFEVQFGRYKNQRKINAYDSNWNLLKFKMGYPNTDYRLEKPKEVDKIKELAEILATGFEYCRVDFYLVKNKIYFGEMTFTPCSGFDKYEPFEWDYKLGELWSI